MSLLKTKSFLFIFLTIFSLSSQANTEPLYHTINSFQEVEKYITQDTWVILDLDHTVFEGATLGYGHANWFYDQVENGIKNGLSKNETIEKIFPHWALSLKRTKVKPVEPMIPSLIKSWQTKKIPVIAATSRQTSIAHTTLEQLKGIGVDFGQVLKDAPALKNVPHPTLIKDSVIFCCDYNEKGPVVLTYLQSQGPLPKHIVFVDDGIGNLKSIKTAFAKTSTEVIALYYPLVEKQKATHWDGAKANQAYYEAYLENPVLPPFFIEHKNQLSKQDQLIDKNTKLNASYEFEINGLRFVGLPEVFSPKVFGEDNALQKAIPLQKEVEILEIGPATGHFAVAAALEGAKKVVAIDISPKAVENTKLNAARFHVENKVDVRCGDIFSAVKANEKFDVIFWDIPFNHREKSPTTQLEKGIFDSNHELLRRYIKEAEQYLKPKGALYLNYSATHGNEDYLMALANHYHWQISKIKEIGDKDSIQIALYQLKK